MKWVLAFVISILAIQVFALPTFTPQLVIKNQQGEQTNNYVLPASTFIAGQIAADTFVCNLTGSKAYPTACTYSQVKTALSLPTNSSTAIAALQNGTPTFQTEAISAAGALSTTVAESQVTNASGSTYAVTLAAPSSQDGQIKVVTAVTTMTHPFTLAMTNIAIGGGYTARGTTTLTFTNVGDTAVFMAVGGKWVYLGGQAVAS